jgi:hypothetical protein
MARYNEILAGRLNNALKKFLSMKGPAPSPQIASEFAATLALYWGVENRFLEEWGRFATTLPVTGGAAQFAAARLRNPAGSNIVVIVEKLTAASTTTDQATWFLSAQAADLTTLTTITNVRLDPRGGKRDPVAQLSTTTNYSAPANSARYRGIYPANTAYDFIQCENQEITVLPGDALDLAGSGVANQLIIPSFLWRERILEESERQ